MTRFLDPSYLRALGEMLFARPAAYWWRLGRLRRRGVPISRATAAVAVTPHNVWIREARLKQALRRRSPVRLSRAGDGRALLEVPPGEAVIFPYAEGSPLRFSEEVFEALVYHWRDVRVLDSYDATRFITPGMTVVDAGANIGMFSLLANGLVGSSGQVYAVEPVPGNLQCLEQCLERNQLTRVKTCGTALGAENGALALSLSSSSGKHSAALDRGGPQITVPQRRLDDLVEEWGLDRLDFLKIDVEGYEPQVLRGAAGCISKFRPVLAVAAYHFPEHVEALPQLIAGIAEDYVVRVGSAARGLETKCWGIPVERGSAGGGRHTR